MMELGPSHPWYLAHPVNQDLHYSYYDNMVDVLMVQKALLALNVWTVNPWFTICRIDELAPRVSASRDECLTFDCTVAKMLGKIILTGHRLSEGMQRELMAVHEVEGHKIIDLIGIPTREYRDIIFHVR